VEFKKIERGCFRELVPTEVRILFMRHADHEENIVTSDEQSKLFGQGQKLADAGIVIAGTVCSTADRALMTVLGTKAGMGKGSCTITDPRLSDLGAEDPELKKNIKAAAQAAGKPSEEYIFEMCQTSDAIYEMMERRGREGADALWDFAQQFRGRTILASSHDGSRMEVVIASL